MNSQAQSVFKLNYLTQELLLLAWNASVQRANPYNAEVSSKERISSNRFREKLMRYVENTLLPHYVSGCTEAQHIANLLLLTDAGTQIGGELFDAGGYRLGVAQKFFNLLLKSLWALDLIPEPPHCPVDRIIIAKATQTVAINWTEMKEIGEYLLAIASLKAEAAASQLSLAEWELRHYSRRNPLRLDVASLSGSRGDPGASA